jgi:hypothetical protein
MACRVGFTDRALIFVETGIVKLESALKTRITTQGDVTGDYVLLAAFRDAIFEHRRFMREDQEQLKNLPLVTNPEKLREFLSHANALARGGYDMSSMSPEAIRRVRVF